MNIPQKFISASLSLATVFLPIKAIATSFNPSQIFYFGDSLGDTGNTFGFTGNLIPPDPPYSNGRVTNGLNWLDYLSQDLGLEPIPNFFETTQGANPFNGVDFAFAGALTGTFMTGDDGVSKFENTLPATFPDLQNLPFPLIGLQSQIGLFANSFAPLANPDALYIVLAGANDYLPSDADTELFRPLTETNTSTNNISLAINSLVGLGATNIMLVDLPDLGQVPVTNVLPENERIEFTNLTNSHNQQLEIIANNLPDNINLIQFDLNELFDDVLTNPTDFGLINVTDGCLDDIICLGLNLSDQYLFWDSRHPTTVVHEIIANAALEELKHVPESSFPLGVLIFGTLGTTGLIKNKRSV